MPETLTIHQQDEQKSRVRSYFNESKQWQGDVYGSTGDYFSRIIQRRMEYALGMIRDLFPAAAHGTRVLDVGCGSGIYLEALRSMGFDVTGVDLSEEMLATCRNRFGMESNDSDAIHLRLGDVEHIPLPDGYFDLVLCVGVFGYLLTDEAARAELRRVLKPGGVLLLNLTNMYSLSDADYVFRRKLRNLLTGSEHREASLCPDYAIQSPWMMNHRKYFFKSYNLRKYERILSGEHFRKLDAMTYGFEFRILRKIHLLPSRWLDRAELVLEHLIRRFSIPYLSYAGWVYTGTFKKE